MSSEGQRLRDWRRAAGVKRTDLGSRLGYSWRTIKAWELGERRITVGVLTALAGILLAMSQEHESRLTILHRQMDQWDRWPTSD